LPDCKESASQEHFLGTVYFKQIFLPMIMKPKYYFTLSLLSLILFLSSCKNPFNADISGIPAEKVEIVRYEQALFHCDFTDASIQNLQQQFPLFLGNAPIDSMQIAQLKSYVQDPYLAKLFAETQKNYLQLGDAKDELAESFRYFKHYFKEFQQPEIYTYISGSPEHVHFQDGVLLVGIDNYLGFNSEPYNITQIPKYKQFAMSPDFLVRDIVLAISAAYIKPPASNAALLEHMIYEGKKLYFIKTMLPKISDKVLFAQTDAHLSWLREKENYLWRYYVENELLYKADYLAYNKFIADAPFTPVLGDDSAPRTGSWLGFHIIFNYMKKNGESLDRMLGNTNAQQILQKSGYKPSR
jgi:hypothetical protein